MIVLLFHLVIKYTLLGVTIPAVVPPHPLHVSTLEITYNFGGKTIEVVGKIFTDDFELALSKQYRTKIDLSSPAKHASMNTLAKEYILANIQIKSNEGSNPLKYLGFEKEKEFVYVYLESEMPTAPKNLDIRVSLLHNLYKDQINIVHATVNGNRKSSKLDFPKNYLKLSF